MLNFTVNLSLTDEASKNYIPYLNLKFKVVDDKLETDLYIKPTDRYHLHCLSYHPELTKCYTVYIQTLRLNRLCSLKKYFNQHELNMKEWFTQSSFPKACIEKEMQKVMFSEQSQQSQLYNRQEPLPVLYKAESEKYFPSRADSFSQKC